VILEMESNKKDLDRNSSDGLIKKIREYWQNLDKNDFILLGVYIGTTPLIWLLFFYEVINLTIPLLHTILWPLVMVLRFYIKLTTDHKWINKIFYVGLMGYILSVPLWLLLGNLFFFAPWAIFPNLSTTQKNISVILLLIASYIVMAAILYGIGAKRNWRIRSSM
jgi:hypothetical protein